MKSAGATLRVLTVEDEPPARRRLRALLEEHEDIDLIGEASDGGQAVQLIQTLRPDLVLLDVQLPIANGFEVIDAIGAEEMPAVIFVTAYDEYALQAFEVYALDYLLKPVESARLDTALRRARARLQGDAGGDRAPLRRAMEEIRSTPTLNRIPVRQGGRIIFVDIADIDYVVAEGNYVRVRARGAHHLIRDTLGAIEHKLRPHGFLRIHRSTLVRTDRIVELQPLFHGEYAVRLKDGTKLTSGRTYREQMRLALSLKDDV